MTASHTVGGVINPPGYFMVSNLSQISRSLKVFYKCICHCNKGHKCAGSLCSVEKCLVVRQWCWTKGGRDRHCHFIEMSSDSIWTAKNNKNKKQTLVVLFKRLAMRLKFGNLLEIEKRDIAFPVLSAEITKVLTRCRKF